jgi:hypothetical protein
VPPTRFSEAVLEGGKLVEKNIVHIDLRAVPGGDPLAFASGFRSGFYNHPLGSAGVAVRELARAYVEGYNLGQRVSLGTEPIPTWARAELDLSTGKRSG